MTLQNFDVKILERKTLACGIKSCGNKKVVITNLDCSMKIWSAKVLNAASNFVVLKSRLGKQNFLNLWIPERSIKTSAA